MTQYEKLKEIADKIGYDIKYNDCNNIMCINKLDQENGGYVNIEIDVREIIFTQEFMDKYKEYFYFFNKDKYNQFGLNQKYVDIKLGLFNNLNNPVEYLYSLIK